MRITTAVLKWLENKIHGKYINRIQELQIYAFKQDSLCSAIRKNHLNMVHKNSEILEKLCRAKEVIEKIESSYSPEDMSNWQELKLSLHVADKPFIDIITVIAPFSLKKGIAGSQRLELSTRLAVGGETTPEFMDELSHELMVALAKECGRNVENKILRNNGWRT